MKEFRKTKEILEIFLCNKMKENNLKLQLKEMYLFRKTPADVTFNYGSTKFVEIVFKARQIGRYFFKFKKAKSSGILKRYGYGFKVMNVKDIFWH